MEVNNELVNSLQVFLVLMVVVIALLTSAMLVIGVRVLSIDKKVRGKDANTAQFEERANELLEQGRLDELVQHAASRVSTHPYHVDARWFLAVGYYHLGDMANAIREFEHVATINPAWEETGVAPFVERITAVYESAHSIAQH